MPKETKKNKGGRPTKLTSRFLEVAEKVLNEDINAVILTDEELVILLNEELKEKEQITKRTFENWKAKVKDSEELDEKGEAFFRLIKKALLKQKKDLFTKFREESNQWQRWAWILERKFDEWNIKHKTDITSKDRPIPLIDFTNGLRDNNGDQENTEA